MDKRRNRRLEINLRCRVASPRIGSQSLTGFTENMSRGDILVQLDGGGEPSELPSAGDPMIVEIDLPANHAFGKKCMQCQTTVVRVSRSEAGSLRVAMRIHKMRFQSCGECSVFEGDSGDVLRQLVM